MADKSKVFIRCPEPDCAHKWLKNPNFLGFVKVYCPRCGRELRLKEESLEELIEVSNEC